MNQLQLDKLRALDKLNLDEFKAFIADKPKSIAQDFIDGTHTLFFFIRKCSPDIIEYAVETLQCKLIFRHHVTSVYSYQIAARIYPLAYPRFQPKIQYAIVNSKDFQVNIETFTRDYSGKHISDEILALAIKRIDFSDTSEEHRVLFFNTLTYYYNIKRINVLFDSVDGMHVEKIEAMSRRSIIGLPFEQTLERATNLGTIANDKELLYRIFGNINFDTRTRTRLILLFNRKLNHAQMKIFTTNMITIACEKFVMSVHPDLFDARMTLENINNSLTILMSLGNEKSHCQLVTSLSTFNIIKNNVTLSPVLILDSTEIVVLRIKNKIYQRHLANHADRYTIMSMREIDYISSESGLPVLTPNVLQPIANIVASFKFDDFESYDFKHYHYMLVVVIVHTALINKEVPSEEAFAIMKSMSLHMRACICNGVAAVNLNPINTKIIDVFEMFVQLTDGLKVADPYDFRQKTYNRLIDWK